MKTMQVTLKLFAAYQEAYGVPEQVITLPTATTVAGMLDQIIVDHPELEQWRSVTRFAVNLDFVQPDTPLQDGDELVLIPPVSGG